MNPRAPKSLLKIGSNGRTIPKPIRSIKTVRKMISRDGFRVAIMRVYCRTQSRQLRRLRKTGNAEAILAEAFATEQTIVRLRQQFPFIVRVIRKCRQPEGGR